MRELRSRDLHRPGRSESIPPLSTADLRPPRPSVRSLIVRVVRALGDTDGNPAHPRFPCHPTAEWSVPRRRSRRRARQFPRLPEGVAQFAHLLCRQGQPGARNPAPARPARLVLRHRLGRRDRDGARCRRDRRAHLVRQHHQERARHPARLRARHPPLRRRLRRRGREGGARRPWRTRLLPRLDGRRGRGMAAVAQVRLRARRWPSTCCAAPSRSASRPMASPSTSARSRPTCPPGTVRWPTPGASSRTLADEGIVLKMVNMGGGFPTRYLRDVPAPRPMAGRSSRRCASISATPCPRPSSSPAAAWSAMPASSSRKSC